MSHSISANNTPRGHFSLSGNGDGDYNRTPRSGSNKESWTPGRGMDNFRGPQSSRNDTSASLRGSPQINLGSGNGDFSHGGHHSNVSRIIPKNCGVDPAYTTSSSAIGQHTGRNPPLSSFPNKISGPMGQQYCRDRERMKEELASNNSARMGNGILPGGVGLDRRTGVPFHSPRSNPTPWNGTARNETMSSNQRPEMYSSATVSGTNLAPAPTTNTSGGRIGINENNNRVSSLISDAQKANELLRSHIADSSSQYQDRLNSYTRPSASWNNVGTGGRKEWLASLADQEKENVRNGNKKQRQDSYRASLERQVEQKTRMRAEEARKFNAHPLGLNYEKPKPFWQSSTRTNRPEDIPIQKRNLAQNSSTRITQYEVPSNRVTQARTNLQNSRISPDNYNQNVPYNPSRNSQHQFSNPSGVGANNANNFRGQDQPHSSSPGRFYEDIPQPSRSQQGMVMHPRMDNNNFSKSTPQMQYQDGPNAPPNGYNGHGHPQTGRPMMAPQPRQMPPPFYPPQVQQPFCGNAAPYPYPQPQLGHPQLQPHLNPMHPALSGYPCPPNGAVAYPPPAAYPYPQPQQPVPYQNPCPPFQHPGVGYPQLPMMMDPYGNPYVAHPYPQAGPQGDMPHPNDPYAHRRPDPNQRYNVDDDEMIQQQAAEFEKQMRLEQEGHNNTHKSSGVPLKPSKSMFSNIESLRCFVEEKLTEKNVDYDELREMVFGRPNNLKISDSDFDYKPIKDMINRAELAEQIRMNERKRALQAAKEQAEEEKLERKLQEFYGMQKQREKNAESQKEEWSRVHISNKKVVSKHFLTEEQNKQSQRKFQNAKIIPREAVPNQKWEDPEISLARKIQPRNVNGGGGDQGFAKNLATSRWHQDPAQWDVNDSEEYSYAQYMKQFDRPSSPPVPALVPKTNEETLRGKLSNKTFSRPRLSPSILNAKANASDMRTRIAVEHDLRNKISNPNFN